MVGYGTPKKKISLAGSVAVVRGADIAKSPTANVSNLFGRKNTGCNCYQ